MGWWDIVSAYLIFGSMIVFCPRLLLGLFFWVSYEPVLAGFAWTWAFFEMIRWFRSEEGKKKLRSWVEKL